MNFFPQPGLPCRGFPTWTEEGVYYNSLTPKEQERWKLEGRAYYISQRPENQGKTPEQNWLQAEAEIRRNKDLSSLLHEAQAATDPQEKALKYAIYNMALDCKEPLSSFSANTLLPENRDAKQQLCRSVTGYLDAEPVTLPETVLTIGELVAFVLTNFKKRQRRPDVWHW